MRAWRSGTSSGNRSASWVSRIPIGLRPGTGSNVAWLTLGTRFRAALPASARMPGLTHGRGLHTSPVPCSAVGASTSAAASSGAPGSGVTEFFDRGLTSKSRLHDRNAGPIGVAGADDELAFDRQVDEVDVHARIGDPAHDRAAGARPILDRAPEHLRRGPNRLAGAIESLPPGDAIGDEDVQDPLAATAGPGDALDVDPSPAQRLHRRCVRAGLVHENDGQICGHRSPLPSKRSIERLIIDLSTALVASPELLDKLDTLGEAFT